MQTKNYIKFLTIKLSIPNSKEEAIITSDRISNYLLSKNIKDSIGWDDDRRKYFMQSNGIRKILNANEYKYEASV